MCLSIPSKVVKISDDQTMCTVDTMGVQRDANLMMMADGDIGLGDYVSSLTTLYHFSIR